MSTDRPLRLLCGVIAVAAIVAGCSGSDADSSDGAVTTETGATEAVTTGPVTSATARDEVVTTEGAGPADPERTALANELMANSMKANLGLNDDDAMCAAVVVVEAVGAENLLDGDDLVDLDSLPADLQSIAAEAFVTAVPDCDIDPADVGAG